MGSKESAEMSYPTQKSMQNNFEQDKAVGVSVRDLKK